MQRLHLCLGGFTVHFKISLVLRIRPAESIHHDVHRLDPQHHVKPDVRIIVALELRRLQQSLVINSSRHGMSGLHLLQRVLNLAFE